MNERDKAVSRLPIFLIRYNQDFGQVLVEDRREQDANDLFPAFGYAYLS